MTVAWKRKGQFNFCGTEEEWQVAIRFGRESPEPHALSEIWPIDEEPHIEGLLPSEVVEVLAERMEAYFYSTGREQRRKVVAWARENAARLDAEWAGEQIARLEKEIARLRPLTEAVEAAP